MFKKNVLLIRVGNGHAELICCLSYTHYYVLYCALWYT